MTVYWCAYCQGRGCLICGPARLRHLEREASESRAREFLKKQGVMPPPELVAVIAVAIDHGMELVLSERQIENAVMEDSLDERFSRLDLDGIEELVS